MRKTLFLALTLLLTHGAAATMPRPIEASSTYCSWQCGPCGAVCPCQYCRGPLPPCACLAD
jgi:hypothetical protein